MYVAELFGSRWPWDVLVVLVLVGLMGLWLAWVVRSERPHAVPGTPPTTPGTGTRKAAAPTRSSSACATGAPPERGALTAAEDQVTCGCCGA